MSILPEKKPERIRWQHKKPEPVQPLELPQQPVITDHKGWWRKWGRAVFIFLTTKHKRNG